MRHELPEDRRLKGLFIVAYANEEPPHFGTMDMGSHVHAKSLHEAGQSDTIETLDFGKMAQVVPGLAGIFP